MFQTHRKALGTGLAALTLAVTAAPAALAQPTDLRSPDTRDAAQPALTVAPGPPSWPVNSQPVTRPRAAASASPSGLDWSSAGIGAAAVVAACAIALVGIGGVRRRRVARPAR